MHNSDFDPETLFREMRRESEKRLDKLRGTLRPFDPYAAAAAIGAAMLLPSFQASTHRLEVLAHTALAGCAGKAFPRPRDLADLATKAANAVGYMEDGAEDVFAGRVIFEGHNYRVLEGLSEAGCHQLQGILDILEGMPTVFDDLKKGCRAVLILSDEICARANVPVFQIGAEEPWRKRVPSTAFPPTRTLRSWVTFDSDALRKIGVSPDALDRFVLPPAQWHMPVNPDGGGPLVTRPLLARNEDRIVAMPTALGPAIRTAVIKACRSFGSMGETILCTKLLEGNVNRVLQTPMLGGRELHPGGITDCVSACAPVEVDAGHWLHLVFVYDDLRGFEEGGLLGWAGNHHDVTRAFADAVRSAQTYCKAQPGFVVGLTYAVTCGVGRGWALESDIQDKTWFVQAASAYDADVLGWRHDFSLADLFRLSTTERDLRDKGFSIRNPHGLIAQAGHALGNRGHLIPHEGLPDGMPGGDLVLPLNGHLRLRADHHQRHDIRAVPTPEGGSARLRRITGGDRSPDGVCRVYSSEDEIGRGLLRAAWVNGNRTWWIAACPRSEESKPCIRSFEALHTWMERIGLVLDEAIPGLPDLMIWNVRIDSQPSSSIADILALDEPGIRATIIVEVDKVRGVIALEVAPEFWHGLFRADNLAEATLVESMVRGALLLAGRDVAEAGALLSRIVPSEEARQLHAFVEQDFRDRIRGWFDPRIIHIGPIQDAALRVGLGWSGVPRPGGTLRGIEACTQALNAITTAAEDALCADLAAFDRRALIEAAIRNHEAAALDERRWNRTGSAILALTGDETRSRREIMKNRSQLNGVFAGCRLLMEIGLHHCPVEGGRAVADLDLSRLMGRAMLIFHLGGWSDAIRYGAMKPEVRISPGGEVQVHDDFDDGVMAPLGRDFSNRVIDRERSAYATYLESPVPITGAERAELDRDFYDAFETEIGAGFQTCREVIDTLEDLCTEVKEAWIVRPRLEFLAWLEDRVPGASAVVTAFESIPRDDWRQVPEGYDDADRQPWRFRRRLSVARRPFLRLRPEEDAELVIVPDQLRQGFASTIYNLYRGQYDVQRLASRAMRKWRDRVVAERGSRFEEDVAAELCRLGWTARRGVKIKAVLGRALDHDPGDIDVLAWHPSGRVMLFECKDLDYAKTPGEVARQLSKFRGKTDEKGRPDLLAKHFSRLNLARDEAQAFTTFTGLAVPTIEAGLIFRNTVPMQFALDNMRTRIWVGTIDDLSEFGPATANE